MDRIMPRDDSGLPGRDDDEMGTSIVLTRRAGSGDGFREDLLLERELDNDVVLDARNLESCHPMFALRLRLFIDWHLNAGHQVHVQAPRDRHVAQQLADLGVADAIEDAVFSLPAPRAERVSTILSLQRFKTFSDVEGIALESVDLLHRQSEAVGCWGNAMFAAVSELCNNALQHGRNELGAYLVADRTSDRGGGQLRLAIADLGIGVPEHIRSQHPEWQDDTAAIARAIERGVSGTGDAYRGNGFSEVFDEAMQTDLVKARSAALIDIRSGRGRVSVELVGGVMKVGGHRSDRPRRGTWITYTITTV
jgi:hypothetical protein